MLLRQIFWRSMDQGGNSLLASFNLFLLSSSQQRCQKPARSCEGQPQSRNRSVPRAMNEIGADRWCKATEDSGGQTICERESGGSYVDRHDLRQEDNHGTVVAAEDKRQPEFDCQKDRKSTRLNSSHITISYAVF